MPRRYLPASYLHRRRWTITDARQAIAALETSGLSTKEFAEREGLELNRLYRWQRRLAQVPGGVAPTTPQLLEIRTCRAEPVEIVLGSGRILRVSERVDTGALARLVAVLERGDGC